MKFIPALIAMSIMGTLWKKRKNSVEYEANEQSVLLATHKTAILWGVTSLFFYDFCALEITLYKRKEKNGNKRNIDFCISKDKSKKSHTDKDCKAYILTAVKKIEFLFVLYFFSYNYTTRKGFSDPSYNLTVMRLLRL